MPAAEWATQPTPFRFSENTNHSSQMVVRRYTDSVTRLIQALTDSTQNFMDKDFSITISSDRDDELGQLVDSHNDVARLLRSERQNLYQRELLLETVFESTPVAMFWSVRNLKATKPITAIRTAFKI